MVIVRILKKIDSIIARVSNQALFISGLMMVIMGFASTYAVVRRYIFSSPEPYSYELSTILLLVGCVLTFAGIQKEKRHLRVDFIANYFPPKVQLFLMDVLGPLAALFFTGITCWKTWQAAMMSFRFGEKSYSLWGEPLWPIKIIIPLGMFWLILILVSQLVHGIANLAGNKSGDDENNSQ